MISSTALNSAKNGASYQFEAYGVTVELLGNERRMVDEIMEIVRISLLNDIREIAVNAPDHRFDMTRTNGGTYILVHNGQRIASGRSRKKFINLVDSMVSVAIGEYAVDKVFMHAGVVGWKGKAIVIPANSFQGKTTLVAELVRQGALYYSDEFAIFDQGALVHPFPRPLAMRSRHNGKLKGYQMTPETLGGTYGTTPIPVGMVLITSYSANSRWSPKLLTPGEGVLKMIPHTLSIRHRPDFSLLVLNKIATHAIIASSRRGSAERFAGTLLNFVDKHVN